MKPTSSEIEQAKQDAIQAVLALMPKELSYKGTLDEIVAAASRAADEAVRGAILAKVAEREVVKPVQAPFCPTPGCSKKNGASVRSKRGPKRS